MSATESQTAENQTAEGEGETRRDFIHLLAGGTAAAAVVGIAIPVIDQMNPAADVRALAQKEVSIAGVEPGMAIKAIWQGKPVFIRRLTEREIAQTEAEPASLIKDNNSRNPEDPGDATYATRVVGPEGATKDFVIVLGVCTHLGCVPLGTDPGETKGDYGGWFCPCHGSHYDPFGRIIKGPAPENLAVPPLQFVTDTTVRLG